MSDTENKSGKTGMIGLLVIVLLLIIGGGVFFVSKQASPPSIEMTKEASAPENQVPDAPPKPEMNAQAVATQAPETSPAAIPAQEDSAAAPLTPMPVVDSAAAPSAPDMDKLLKPRTLGDTTAPVKIVEHASFSCGACAAFHRTNLKDLKNDYVNTGKAYIVYDDFPRNVVDIQIGALARCLPDDSYFNFVQVVYENQQDWMSGDVNTYMIQNAVVAGLSKEKAESCMNDPKVQEALAASRKTAMEKFNVNATPTLIINDKIMLPGLSAYEELKKAIDAEYEKATSGAQPHQGDAGVPAATPTATP